MYLCMMPLLARKSETRPRNSCSLSEEMTLGLGRTSLTNWDTFTFTSCCVFCFSGFAQIWRVKQSTSTRNAE